jgi:hypothetical protein
MSTESNENTKFRYYRVLNYKNGSPLGIYYGGVLILKGDIFPGSMYLAISPNMFLHPCYHKEQHDDS